MLGWACPVQRGLRPLAQRGAVPVVRACPGTLTMPLAHEPPPQRLETHNVLNEEEVEERKALAAIQMQMLRSIAEKHGEQGPGAK